MPDLLLELFSEEIPARMQRKAAGDLRKLVTDALVDAGLTYEGAREYWTPRRLALDIRGLTARSADIREEKKGPRTDAPAKAIEGFLRAAGLSSVTEAQVQSDPKKGEFYVAVIERPGRDAREIIADALPKIFRDFPWPKSMRWGEASREPGSLRWVRPLQSILCLFGPETDETEIIDFEVEGIRSGNRTRGHRFLAPAEITVRRFDDYVASLERAFVILDADRRKEIILAEARNLAFAQGYELVEDEGLAEETANLVEWPIVLMGEFEEAFLAIPDEVTRLTIRTNQKCFVLRASRPASPAPQHEGANMNAPHPEVRPSGHDPRGVSKDEGQLVNRFLLVANVVPSDGGAEIARGNGKVVRARLSDAKFFYDSDLAVAKSDGGFDKWVKGLDGVTFHAKLGSQGERVKRIVALAKELAPVVGADPTKAERAAWLAKADLQSAMVFEFPEVQGKMGRRYYEAAHRLSPSSFEAVASLRFALAPQDEGEGSDASSHPHPEVRPSGHDPRGASKGEDSWTPADHASIASAIEEHYKPLGPSDDVPSDPVSVAVALADKLDTLVGFWAIDEKPTGSKDPYALRRAALGVIRLVVENEVRLTHESEDGPRALSAFISGSLGEVLANNYIREVRENLDDVRRLELANFLRRGTHAEAIERFLGATAREEFLAWTRPIAEPAANSLIFFFHDRLKVWLRDTGARHDLIDAVVTPESDDLLLIVRKVRALQELVESDDGANLLVAYRRAANILAAEAKKGDLGPLQVEAKRLALESELELFQRMNQAASAASEAVEKEDFSGAMKALATLRAPIDSFFEKVLVNDPDPNLRLNRLALLETFRKATATVADFSKIAG